VSGNGGIEHKMRCNTCRDSGESNGWGQGGGRLGLGERERENKLLREFIGNDVNWRVKNSLPGDGEGPRDCKDIVTK